MQAGFLDFDSLSEVALGMEPMLDQVRQGALTLDESTVALLLEAQGSLEDGISQLRAFDTSPLDVGGLLERLQVAATGEAAPAAPAAAEALPEEIPVAEDGEPSPEAQIAATTSAGNPNDLPQHEDEEADSAAPEPVAADPADIEVELEEVQWTKGPLAKRAWNLCPTSSPKAPKFSTNSTKIWSASKKPAMI